MSSMAPLPPRGGFGSANSSTAPTTPAPIRIGVPTPENRPLPAELTTRPAACAVSAIASTPLLATVLIVSGRCNLLSRDRVLGHVPLARRFVGDRDVDRRVPEATPEPIVLGVDRGRVAVHRVLADVGHQAVPALLDAGVAEHLLDVRELLAPVTREREHVQVRRARDLLLGSERAVRILVVRGRIRLVVAAQLEQVLVLRVVQLVERPHVVEVLERAIAGRTRVARRGVVNEREQRSMRASEADVATRPSRWTATSSSVAQKLRLWMYVSRRSASARSMSASVPRHRFTTRGAALARIAGVNVAAIAATCSPVVRGHRVPSSSSIEPRLVKARWRSSR